MRRGENDRLRGLSHLAIALYAIALRPRSVDGFVRGTTWATLGRDVSVAPLPGASGDSVDTSRVRRACGALVRAGLLIALPGSGPDFELPHARPTGEKLQADRLNTSNGAACSMEADRVKQDRPTGLEVENMQADRPKASNGAGSRGEADRSAARSFSDDGAPSPSSPRSPPITPSLPPSNHSPTLAARAREIEQPFVLTAPPAHDQPQLLEPTEGKTRVPQPFMPTLATIKALQQKGVEQTLALGEVGHFATWWADQAGNGGYKRASGWQLAFINWCLKLAPKNGTAKELNHGRRLSASERNAEAIRRARTDRRT
jgi:hypothetical protein